MVKFISSAALLFVALSVSSCKDEESNRTVEYYLNNPDDRAETLAKCEVTDGSVLEANCKNAQEADEIQAAETNKEDRSDAINSLFGSEN